ncbi:NUDIX domain-containing protein [Mastigocoleus testarum]|uniref:NUDIX domain-containing protein n=1 Tax=Mastigocoleus testarum TaxID=996925 RepID=UPI000400D3D1|nr:NUDIX domain-containing protein [Mastigocoleus testarum]
MIDALVWICIKDRQVLCTRTHGKDVFYMPGGKREDGESDWDGLFREIQEEVTFPHYNL